MSVPDNERWNPFTEMTLPVVRKRSQNECSCAEPIPLSSYAKPAEFFDPGWNSQRTVCCQRSEHKEFNIKFLYRNNLLRDRIVKNALKATKYVQCDESFDCRNIAQEVEIAKLVTKGSGIDDARYALLAHDLCTKNGSLDKSFFEQTSSKLDPATIHRINALLVLDAGSVKLRKNKLGAHAFIFCLRNWIKSQLQFGKQRKEILSNGLVTFNVFPALDSNIRKFAEKIPGMHSTTLIGSKLASVSKLNRTSDRHRNDEYFHLYSYLRENLFDCDPIDNQFFGLDSSKKLLFAFDKSRYGSVPETALLDESFACALTIMNSVKQTKFSLAHQNHLNILQKNFNAYKCGGCSGKSIGKLPQNVTDGLNALIDANVLSSGETICPATSFYVSYEKSVQAESDEIIKSAKNKKILLASMKAVKPFVSCVRASTSEQKVNLTEILAFWLALKRLRFSVLEHIRVLGPEPINTNEALFDDIRFAFFFGLIVAVRHCKMPIPEDINEQMMQAAIRQPWLKINFIRGSLFFDRLSAFWTDEKLTTVGFDLHGKYRYLITKSNPVPLKHFHVAERTMLLKAFANGPMIQVSSKLLKDRTDEEMYQWSDLKHVWNLFKCVNESDLKYFDEFDDPQLQKRSFTQMSGINPSLLMKVLYVNAIKIGCIERLM